MVTEFPLPLLSEMAQRDRELDPYRRQTAPLPHSNGIAQNGTQNGSGLSEEIWSDMALYQYYFNRNNNVNPSLPQLHQPRNVGRSAQWLGNGRSLNVGGVNEGRRMSMVGREGNGLSFNEHPEMIGQDTGNQHDFSGIFQDHVPYPIPSPAAGLNSNIISASSNVLDSGASNNYGSLLGSPLSQNGLPDPEVAMRVPSPGIPPIGVKINSIDNRRMTTNGSSTFSNVSAGFDATDQILSDLSALNLQQGAGACYSSSMHSYAGWERENSICSPVSNNFLDLPENSYSGLNMNGVPGLFNQAGNHGCSPLQILPQNYHQMLELLKYIKNGGTELARQQKMPQQLPSHYSDDGFVPGYMTNFAVRSGYYLPGVRKPTSSPKNHIPTTFLEEFKSNKTKCYELSELAGNVFVLSTDQHGSRYIQQKLETATTTEKDMVFDEIMPHAIDLMTDVFGNYVVQKFFEHGSAAQIKELAKQLNGRVLSLSLQMYGCRVIQKAIEVVDLEQQTQMVSELEGSELRCVRDQNGNHVIQKCIECVPQDVIHFIISVFYEHVLVLSTHAYGCRVIQRVLEHCDNPKTQEIMMTEILKNVLLLSQDQYGNYVVQHVLEHGKPHEKSAIIEKLAGQILNMSRQKYASNVVEKCLAFGTPVERQMLIAEMLGPTEENEALQEMMKDQYGNYVVQKVLDTCSDQQREMILTRIKIHLTALKKFTYGKHIVARVEKLVVAGERRLAIQSGAPVSQSEEGVKRNYV